MPSAQLIHRGEAFQFIDGNDRYEGACLWSWAKVAGSAPTRVAPVFIHARSIRRIGFKRLLPFSSDKKVALAHQAQVLLAAGEPSLRFVVVEDMPTLGGPRVRVREGLLRVGEQALPVDAIRRVTIAPLYDVPPADDLWCFIAEGGCEVAFLNRDSGATEALHQLAALLPGLDVEQALQFARAESVVEDAVTVWSATPAEREAGHGL
jgi:hypothetical protein